MAQVIQHTRENAFGDIRKECFVQKQPFTRNNAFPHLNFFFFFNTEDSVLAFKIFILQ